MYNYIERMFNIKEGYVIIEDLANAIRSKNGQKLVSKNRKHWVAQIDLKTCKPCSTMHGKIFPMRELLSVRPPLHPFCRCKIKPMNAVSSGYATQDGTAGADYWLKTYGQLPANYINKTALLAAGWHRGQAPADYAPGTPGRVWYEADINYYSGKRNSQRVLWSNDGLVFVSYDHYRTFVEII